jgi:hypothetical protein
MLFNPFLRRHGWVIATEIDDESGKVLRYIVKKYDKNTPLEPEHPNLPGG